MKDVAIIGGGLAGLVNAILLNRAGLKVSLFEEKKYPFHRVCGEYISNEVIPFLKKHDLFPSEIEPSKITQFALTSPKGRHFKMPLDLGGFGISRHALDHWLVQQAVKEGVELHHVRVTSIQFDTDRFVLTDKSGQTHHSKLAIGAFGKRSVLDKSLNRKFTQKRHPYVGVKYHIQTDKVARDIVELHNFSQGYCGVNRVENDRFNLCYLSHRHNLKKHGSVTKMEHEVLYKNPFLKQIFENAIFLFDKPEVINEITFEKKEPVFNHILMAGDSAGMITPLCGNGMAMAIHSAKVLSELICRYFHEDWTRATLEKSYQSAWNNLFAGRLWVGRSIQKLFGASAVSELTVSAGKNIPKFAGLLMKQTHGAPFS